MSHPVTAPARLLQVIRPEQFSVGAPYCPLLDLIAQTNAHLCEVLLSPFELINQQGLGKEVMEQIDITAVCRMALIYGHLLAFAIASAAVAFGDFAIFARHRVHPVLLAKSASTVTIALSALWVTGLAVIWLDTRFEPNQLMASGKLLAKLTVVTVLTANGIAMHYFVFPRLLQPQHSPHQSALLPAVLGAISGATWLFAAFLGVAKALARPLGYSGFITLYILALVSGISMALIIVRPRLAGQIRGLPEHAIQRRADTRDRRAGDRRSGIYWDRRQS